MKGNLRSDFPFFKANSGMAYLDNAATTQKPQCVIDSVVRFMTEQNSNTGRSLYPLSSDAARMLSDARAKIASFINADSDEIILTGGSTEALNIVASSLCHSRTRGNIVITGLEHSSNCAPWMEHCRRNGIELRVAKTDPDGSLDPRSVTDMIDKETIAVSVTGMSNVTGFMPEISAICRTARARGAFSVIDAAQLVVHRKVDVKEIGCDFLAFSGHKLYGPQGTGVLYAARNARTFLYPLMLGGGSVESDYRPKESPEGYEAGSRNIAGLVGLGTAIDYLKQHEDAIKQVEEDLSEYLFSSLKKLSFVKPVNVLPSPIVSFSMDGLGAYDIGTLLAQRGVYIRTGACCAYNLMRALKVEGVCRASVSFCNTGEEIDRLVEGLVWINGRYGGRG